MTYTANTGTNVLELGWDFAYDRNNKYTGETPAGTYELTNRLAAGRLPEGAFVKNAYLNTSGIYEGASGVNIKCTLGSTDLFSASSMPTTPTLFENSLMTRGMDGNPFFQKSTESFARDDVNFQDETFTSQSALSNISYSTIRVGSGATDGAVYLVVAGNSMFTGRMHLIIEYIYPSGNVFPN